MPKKKKKRVVAKKQVLKERLDLRISPKEKKVFQEAAGRQGISLSLWLRLAAWRTINEHDGKVTLLDLDA